MHILQYRYTFTKTFEICDITVIFPEAKYKELVLYSEVPLVVEDNLYRQTFQQTVSANVYHALLHKVDNPIIT